MTPSQKRDFNLYASFDYDFMNILKTSAGAMHSGWFYYGLVDRMITNRPTKNTVLE